MDATRVSLYTYPVLMAADVLLYRPEQVPVGDDQRQHLELTRDLALRFNRTYGPVFTVPEISTPAAGARVMSLSDPTSKMGKSDVDAAGNLYLLDPPDVIRRKVSRAVTDSDTGADAVRSDRATKPGVTNLLEILTACGGSADGIATYGALKAAVTDAVVAEIEPLQRRYAALAADRAHVSARTTPAPPAVARSPPPCSRRPGPRSAWCEGWQPSLGVRIPRRARASGCVRPPSPRGTPPAPCGSRAHAAQRRWCRRAR